MRYLVAIMALSLTGCAAQQQENQARAAQAQAASDDAQCQAYGAQPGTPVYIQCRMNLDNQRAAAYETNRAIVLQRMIR